MKDFRIVAKIYNNQLRERREATGLTACGFAKKIGIQPSAYCAYESMKRTPLTKGRGSRGAPRPKTWRAEAQQIAGALGAEPEILWPEAVLEIKKTVSEVRVDATDIAAMLPPAESSPFLLLSAAEETEALSGAIGTLNEREQAVLQRHYIDGESLEEIGDDFGVTRERMRQIEKAAIGKLRRHEDIKNLRRAS